MKPNLSFSRKYVGLVKADTKSLEGKWQEISHEEHRSPASHLKASCICLSLLTNTQSISFNHPFKHSFPQCRLGCIVL